MESPDGQDFVIVDRKDVEQYNVERILPQSPEDIAEIRKWLQPTDYLADSSEYEKHLNSHLRGTGTWIQQTEAYQQWHDSPEHGALWTKAIAGAGKSVFAAMTAAKLAFKEKVPVLFFFFRQIVATNHHPQSLARDFIAQLLRHSPVLQATMKKYLDNRRTIDSVSMSQLWADLMHALLSFTKVYCVVDALDEMDIDQEAFFLDLLKLGQLKPSSIKVLMTSRPLPRIEQALKDPSILQIRLEQRLVDQDIAVYVTHRLNQQPDFNDELRQAVKDEIGIKSQGSFLYARLMMDELTSHFEHMIPDINVIRRSLSWLPITLEDMYSGMLLDHSLRSRVPQELQIMILRWVTHSSRPLRLLEIATMLDSLNDAKKGKDTKAVVRAACGPLLEILEDETVSVIHHSFTEFLTDSGREGRKAPGSVHPQFPVIGTPTTHRLLAVICLRYLKSGCLSNWTVTQRSEDDYFYNHPKAAQQGINLQHPFLGYVVANWSFHVKKIGGIDDVLCSMLDEFMQVDNHDFRAWLDLAWHGPNLEKTSPLHVAAWTGLADYVKHVLKLGHDCDTPDAQQRTPLSWAAGKGYSEIVSLLLKHGSDPDSDDSVGLKPLHHAASANHHAVVKLLLEAGVSPLTPKTKENPGRHCGNAPTTTGHSPLLYACQAGNAETVREMMPYLQPKDLDNSLCIAAKCGKSQLVDLLLTSPDTSVDPENADDTPLFLASAGLHLDIMRSLLRKGADPMRRSKNYHTGMQWFSLEDLAKKKDPGSTPFHALCGGSKDRHHGRSPADEDTLRKCFKLLCEAGCDINATDNQGKTPLHYSVVQGDHSKANNVLSSILLDNGADLMARDKEHNTPLHLVQLFKDSAPTIEALIANGGDLTATRAKDGKTPLHCMVESIHGLDLKVLLPHVTNWNIQDAEGNTPLHLILSKSYDPNKVLCDLLEAGADLNARNKKGEVPLLVLRELRNMGKDIVPTLLKAGADLEAKDNAGRTILMRKLMGIGEHHDISAIVEDLLSYGSKVDTRDNEGNGVLHAVCRKIADAKLLRRLIDAGANPHFVNHAGNTLLHEVAINYKSHSEDKLDESVSLLLQLGISPKTRNHLGQTPLHLVFGSILANLSGNKQDPTAVFLSPSFRALLDEQDNDGVRAIHLAATISEELVSRLLDMGACSTALTYEGRSVLHVSARARQSNIIGCMLDQWSSSNHSEMVDHPDSQGRTALHDACRSGRPESVALLLKAGANPNAKDKSDCTPLHACAEFEEENKLWDTAPQAVHRLNICAAGVLLSDTSRPASRDSYNQHQAGRSGKWSLITIENDTCRVRDIIRLLVAHGADVDTLAKGGSFAIDLAMSNGCEEMVNELLPSLDRVYVNATEEMRQWSWRGRRSRDKFHEAYATMRGKLLIGILEEEINSNGYMKFRRAHELLALREFDAIEQLPRMGLDFTPQVKEWSGDFLSVLVKWGYASLLERLGATINDSWANGLVNPEKENEYSVNPYILTAVYRHLPNLEIIKILVDEFGADVNVQPPSRTYRNGGGYEYPPGVTPLHILASGTHWWQAEALEYLLSKGANTELRNELGQTSLHVAVSAGHSHSRYRQRITTKVLLEHGADPNSIDESGLTCLNKAIHDAELVGMLIRHGADIALGSKPILFSAIAAQDLPTLKILLSTGADCNTRQKRCENVKPMQSYGMEEHEYYPIHYAASTQFDKPQNRETAIAIINMLLENGADPYLQFRDNACVLHHILSHGGILQPFLEIPNLELERRDPKGRTLLLAACSSSRGTYSPTNFQTAGFDPTPFETRRKAVTKDDPTAALTLFEMGADSLAVDNDGNNVLHLLVLASPHNNDEYKKTFELFLEKEPSLVSQKNKAGWKPYHYAVQNRRTWTTQQLIKAGADPLEQDPDGNTALHHLSSIMCATGKQWVPTFKEFLDLGIPIDTPNKKGETPLFGYFATNCSWQNSNQARKHFSPFREAGADVFVKNNEGEGLLHVVAKRVYGNFIVRRENKSDVVDSFRFLMELGLDPGMEDRNQRSALDVAAACGNTRVLELFKRDAGAVTVPAVAAEESDDDEDW